MMDTAHSPDSRPSFYLYGKDAKACLAAKGKDGKVKTEVVLETDHAKITKKEPFVEVKVFVDSIGGKKMTGRHPYTMEYGTKMEQDIGKTIKEMNSKMEAGK